MIQIKFNRNCQFIRCGDPITSHVFKLSLQDIRKWTKELEGKREIRIITQRTRSWAMVTCSVRRLRHHAAPAPASEKLHLIPLMSLRTLRECQWRVTNNCRLLCHDTAAPTTNHLRPLTRAIVEAHHHFIAIRRLPDGPGSSFIAPTFSPWALLA